MKRIQSILTAVIMVLSAIGNSDYFLNTGVHADVVPYVEAEQCDEIYEESRTPEAEASTTPLVSSKITTTSTVRPKTSNLGKESFTTTTTSTTTTTATTTTTTEVTTTTTTTTAPVTTVTTEEVVPVTVEETFNEEEVLEENIESNVYSTGERETPVDTVAERTWNRAEWPEEWLPSFAATITYTDRDLQALYNVVQHEVGSCSQRSKYIVTSNIINRVIQGWGSSIYDVVTAPGQFSGVWSYINNTNYATQDTIDCVNHVLASGIDYIDGGTSFYNPYYCGYISWFENQELVGEYEGHRYFRQR